MKNKMKFLGTQSWRLCFIALVAVIGFSFIACSNGGGGGGGSRGGSGVTGGTVPAVGSGQYTGTDALGNSYKLYVGSSIPARAAITGDNFRLEITTRDGEISVVTGTVTDISTDGTLTLKPNGRGAEPIVAVVKGNTLTSVASATEKVPEITLDNGTKITPRSFNTVHLRLNRWTASDGVLWDQWNNPGILLTDFPTNVNRITEEENRYTITVSGTSDKALDYLITEIHGITEEGRSRWLANGTINGRKISANQAFTETFYLFEFNDDASLYLTDYKEIYMQITNVFRRGEAGEWETNNGTTPTNIPNDQIMATISNFNISLKDTKKAAATGNLGDYTYGYDGATAKVQYNQAVWSLSAANVANAKKSGAKFEFTIKDFEENHPQLYFIWQDPVRGLWWEDETPITDTIEIEEGKDNWVYKIHDGASYKDGKVRIDLSKIIKDNRFDSATQLNFIIASWWCYEWQDQENKGQKVRKIIDDYDILGAGITFPEPIVVNNPIFSSQWNTTATVGNDGWVTWSGEAALIAWEFPDVWWDSYNKITVTYAVRNVNKAVGSDALQLIIKRPKNGEMDTLLEPNYGTIKDTSGNYLYPRLSESGGTLVIDRVAANFDGCIGFQFNDDGYGYDIKITKVEFHN